MKIINNPFLNIFHLLTLLILISGCSGGGGGTVAPTTASSFPNVVGSYSFNTSVFNMTCTDGSTATNPALALNFNVTQNANQITIVNTSVTGGIPGITIIDISDPIGNVQTNGTFILNQTATANFTGISGTVTLSYNQTGTFTTGGWSGTYTYTATAPSLGGSCTFKASFTGDKIVTGVQIESTLIDLNGLPPDIYDTYGHIGRAVAQ